MLNFAMKFSIVVMASYRFAILGVIRDTGEGEKVREDIAAV